MSNKNYHILIVDDDTEFHQQIRFAFRRNYVFEGAIDADHLQDKLNENKQFDLILLDLVFDDTQKKIGLELIPVLKEKAPNVPIIVATADRSIDTVVEVGIPIVLKKSSNRMSVIITAIKMNMISSK